jgi:hypothetical protein
MAKVANQYIIQLSLVRVAASGGDDMPYMIPCRMTTNREIPSDNQPAGVSPFVRRPSISMELFQICETIPAMKLTARPANVITVSVLCKSMLVALRYSPRQKRRHLLSRSGQSSQARGTASKSSHSFKADFEISGATQLASVETGAVFRTCFPLKRGERFRGL